MVAKHIKTTAGSYLPVQLSQDDINAYVSWINSINILGVG